MTSIVSPGHENVRNPSYMHVIVTGVITEDRDETA
jgi:hypothetical protein